MTAKGTTSASGRLRIVVIGLGPIGRAVLKLAAGRPQLQIVGAVDLDPAKLGKDAGELAGAGRLDVRVVGALGKIETPAVAVLCTGSRLAAVASQIDTLLAARLSIVSTCEELVYPWHTQPALAERLDTAAQRAGVAILATGVNPGFSMDALPLVVSAACAEVRALRVERVQDAAQRRLPFQRKIGAGLTPEEFTARRARGELGHVGFAESIGMLADGLGWRLERVTDEASPRLTDQEVRSAELVVPAGCVAGIVQEGVGYVDGAPRIRLRMEAYLGAAESYDTVDIEGVPALQLRFAGGLPGDVTTAAMVVNSLARVARAPAGLHSMRSLPLPSHGP